ncbi:MAG: phosphoribosyl-AMP cyclohydrolase [Hymenobacter sp.]
MNPELDFQKMPDQLIPAIVQDVATGQVLMLGYFNAEAWARTQAEGRVTFFSRAKQRLWTKGETSGNYLQVASLHVDCDQDTVLVMARPAGPTCHRGTTSCFEPLAGAGGRGRCPAARPRRGLPGRVGPTYRAAAAEPRRRAGLLHGASF